MAIYAATFETNNLAVHALGGCQVYGENGKGDCRGAGEYRASQAIRATMRIFSGAYIGHSADFLKRVAGLLPERFPRAGSRSVRRCRAFVWELPRPDLLKTAA